MGMKLCVFLIFQLCPWIIEVGNWALRWTEGNETLQIIFVMLIFPVIMNALQYYIIDGFIKNQKPDEHEAIPSDDSDDEGNGSGLQQTNAWDTADYDEQTVVAPHKSKRNKKNTASKISQLKGGDGMDEYNPDRDGDETMVGSGSSSSLTGAMEQEGLLEETKAPRSRE
jgi:hypothetical protein